MPLFGEFSRSSQDLGESDYDSIKSRDDQPNSSKSGMWIFRDWNTGDVLSGIEEMSSVEHRRCPPWNTGDVLPGTHQMFAIGTHEMSCVEHRKCSAWNTVNVLPGAQELSRLDQRNCPAWNTSDALHGTQEMLCMGTGIQFHGGTIPPSFSKCSFSTLRMS